MPAFFKAVRAWVRACLRFLFRVFRLAFILALVALPVPIAAFVVALLDPARRNLPAQVLRKK
ncbi:hypothetical protein [Hyalangium rubrum]|uniref:Sugar transferase n=1 Tax=Hyalangium rubrum TaxID=3103134 RepID=A0ABU5HHZ5_9BACT|nr:hypothetical protein [Hyalangium sp. s54d21]MDY7232976.1 hypothetical protein [Hyalangium sp. s54d21]